MIYLFEDDTTSNFRPLVDLRPVYDLRCGLRTLREKITAHYPLEPCGLLSRPALKPLVESQNPGIPVNAPADHHALYINGRVLMDEALARILPVEGPECMYMQGETLIAARLHRTPSPKLFQQRPAGFSDSEAVTTIDVQARTVNYIWDLIRHHPEALMVDYRHLEAPPADMAAYPDVHILHGESVHIGADTVVMPGVVLDATEGPVIIGNGVHIMPHAYLQGPVAVGDHTVVRAGTRLYAGTSIGPVCKVGGEIAASILHGYTNKQHDGFLGHAYLGEWINIGAGANNSNLKNTYGDITVTFNKERIDTGMKFLGLIAGDYVKAGIGTQFTTGTLIGFSSHIAGIPFPPSFVPPFSWYTGEGCTEFRIEKALEAAQRMMARRQVEMSLAIQHRFKQIHEEAAENHNRPDLIG